MADAKKLSSMDASFLYLETPEMPMHVGSMAIFRLPENYNGNFFEDFKAMIASRLHIAPILKARLEKARSTSIIPSWVEDDQFDIDRHIFRGSLPAPYDRATLERIVGWMHAKLLNRARPLWEFYVFEGMKDNEIGLYSKMHHACIDGGAGAALTNMIYDVTPVPRVVEQPIPQAKGGNEPRDIAANLIDSYQQLWRQPFDGSSTPKTLDLPRSGKSDLGSILFDNAMFQIESAVKFAGSIPAMLKSVTDVVGKISDPKSRDSIASMVSPPTILNKAISSERSFAGTSISLSRAKAVAKASGGKLNDVVLALSSGRGPALSAGARRLAGQVDDRRGADLAARGGQHRGQQPGVRHDLLDRHQLRGSRRRGWRRSSRSPPSPRRCRIRCGPSCRRSPTSRCSARRSWCRSWRCSTAARTCRTCLPPSANITVSNVPGPRQTLYAAGAELLHIFPVSISTHGIALNITVQSYRDQLDFGFIAGANIIPHVQVMCDMLPSNLRRWRRRLRRRRA
jgi:hypothetical protein